MEKACGAHAALGVKYTIQHFIPVNEQITIQDIKMYYDYFNVVGF